MPNYPTPRSALPRRATVKTWAQNLALLATSIVVTLFLLEIVARILAYGNDEGRLENLERIQAKSWPVSNERRDQLALAGKIRLSKNPEIIYELIPELQVTDDLGKKQTVNSAGFRGPLIPFEKGPRTIRIVGLGDSEMYGHGVGDQEYFLFLLQQKLSQAYPDETWQIVNTAVDGYNTAMEVAVLKDKGLAYQPDIVIMMFVGNDYSLPNFIRDAVDLFAPRSFLLDMVREEVDGLVRTRGLVEAPREEGHHYFERDPWDVPTAYRHMVGKRGYRRAMTELKSLSLQHGFELIVFQKLNDPYVIQTCADLDIPLVSFSRVIDEYQKAHGIRQWLGSELSVSDTDPHPSPIGHRLYADEIYRVLEQSGMIERARVRQQSGTRPLP